MLLAAAVLAASAFAADADGAARPQGVTFRIPDQAVPLSPVAISAGGRFVAFVACDVRYNTPSVVVRDRVSRMTVHADVTVDGHPPTGPSGELDEAHSSFPIGGAVSC